MSFGCLYLDTLFPAENAHYPEMSEIESARRTEALDHVSQALMLLAKVQIRWRRYADTVAFANAAAPIEMILRTVENILLIRTDAHLADTARMLSGILLALRKINRDELRSVIEKTQAAYESVLERG